MEEIKTKDGGIILTKGGTKLLKLNQTKMRKPTIINIPKVNHNTNNPTNNPTNNHHNLNLKGGINTQIVDLTLLKSTKPFLPINLT
ncbi:hypothetical protein AHAS_Ahas20G0144400 [Arachis hypogaea]